MKRLKSLGAALLAVAGVIPWAACGGVRDTLTVSPLPTEPTATIVLLPMATVTPGPSPFQGSYEPLEKERYAPPVALLVAIRTGRHEGFDRITFEFEGGLPGYRIAYAAPPITADPSGLPVAMAGTAFLSVQFRWAAAHDPNTGQPTYYGAFDIRSELPTLVEARRTGDFEGYLTWVLGLTAKTPFRVIELTDPFRVAVDVAHP